MQSKRGDGLRVAVTGAAGYVGSQLVNALAQRDDVALVAAVDLRPTRALSPKVSVLVADVSRPLTELFALQRPDIVVHLAYLMQPRRGGDAGWGVNVGGTANVLRACEATGVQQVLYFSSTSVYGARPGNPVPLTEESQLRPVKGFHYSEHKAAAEALIQEFARSHPEMCVTVLRGCVVMGPHADNFITRSLTKPLMVGVLAHDPKMQFLHEQDLLGVLAYFLEHPKSGVFNIAGEGTVRYSEVVRLAGRPLLWLPAWLLYPLIQVLWVLRLQSASPACGLDLVRWPWVASAEKLRQETGFRFQYTSREALEAFIAARRAKSP